MADDRGALFDEIRKFGQRKLKKVDVKVTTPSGESVTERRCPKGIVATKVDGIPGTGYVVDTKPDLQVGMIIPGLFIGRLDDFRCSNMRQDHSSKLDCSVNLEHERLL